VENQFVVYYQSQVDSSGRVFGAEALVRWQHPQRGLVSPAEFISLAEETELIVPLGDWVLRTACTQLAAWSRDCSMADLSLAVNVSAHQFKQPDFVANLLALIAQTGAPAAKLKLELTESLLLENTESVIAIMLVLKIYGICFSLDDFGTGYSSLAYLKRLPLDQLKIDQSFVRDILTDPNDAAIASTIVALGQSMRLAVIAEGVETQGQRDFLESSGCHAYQGYLFSRPLSLEGFEAFVGNQVTTH
jgi:EAL domain-containing protein (putative c-di-GMP-specific phosphodiesterase class I)